MAVKQIYLVRHCESEGNAVCRTQSEVDSLVTRKGVRQCEALRERLHGVVFKEVCPAVSNIITTHLAENDISTDKVKKLWLHQANINMIDLILRTVMGKDADKSIAPIVIYNYGNTSSASPIIAFHECQDGVDSGDLAVICSFGAGYSIGSVIVKKV